MLCNVLRQRVRTVTRLTLMIAAILCAACASPKGAESAQQSCDSLVAAHRAALEALFEQAMRSPLEFREHSETLHKLNVYERGADGNLRDPAVVVADAIAALAQMPDVQDRQQLEYVLLGPVMSLDSRRAFEAVCVARRAQ